jgi:ribose transport system substrate-binding protein
MMRAWRVSGLLALACVLATACGSSAGSGTGSASKSAASGANVAAAEQLVKQAEAPQTSWKPAGQPFNSTGLRGKSMWYVSINLSIPFEQYVLQGMKQGAATVGVKVTGFDAKSSVTNVESGIAEAIQAKAGVIFVDGVPAKNVAPAIAQAKAAGIPVLTANAQGEGPLLPGNPPGVVGNATHPFAGPGKLMADWLVADSKGNANVLFLSSKDVPVIAALVEGGFVSELHRLCPGCKVTVVDSPTSQWNQLTTITSSLIRKYPSANYLAADFDGQVIFMVPGVTAAGAQNKVKIVSFNATPSVMQDIKNHNVVGGDVGGPNLLQGWAFAEEGLRVLDGLPALNDLNIPTRLFDSANISSINLSAQESQWYGVGDYQAAYAKLWGASSS